MPPVPSTITSEIAAEMARWNAVDPSPAFRQYREPVDALLQRIVASLVELYVPRSGPTAEFLEVCCGHGQLGEWLPGWFAERIIHTDLSPAAINHLARAHPDARAAVADVRSLPFGDAQFQAVVGLCALDSLPQPRAARDEIRRVLAPGGVLLHWMDMQASPEGLFSHLVERGEVPLPNFLDPANLVSIRPEVRSRLPTVKLLDDFLAVPRLALARLVEFLDCCNSTDAAEIAPFVQRFAPGNFAPTETTRAFMSLMADAPRLERIRQRLLTLWLQFGSGQHEEVPAIPLRPISSARFVQERFERLYAPAEGFAPILSEIVSLRGVAARGDHVPEQFKFHLRSVGRTLSLEKIPPQVIGVPLEQFTRQAVDRLPPADSGAGNLVLEAGVYVFVAKRLDAEAASP